MIKAHVHVCMKSMHEGNHQKPRYTPCEQGLQPICKKESQGKGPLHQECAFGFSPLSLPLGHILYTFSLYSMQGSTPSLLLLEGNSFLTLASLEDDPRDNDPTPPPFLNAHWPPSKQINSKRRPLISTMAKNDWVNSWSGGQVSMIASYI